jgi:hypothetical protein
MAIAPTPLPSRIRHELHQVTRSGPDDDNTSRRTVTMNETLGCAVQCASCTKTRWFPCGNEWHRSPQWNPSYCPHSPPHYSILHTIMRTLGRNLSRCLSSNHTVTLSLHETNPMYLHKTELCSFQMEQCTEAGWPHSLQGSLAVGHQNGQPGALQAEPIDALLQRGA